MHIFSIHTHTTFYWGKTGCIAGVVTLQLSSPLLTSVAFFSASSSFSWASLRASEYLSSSSSVAFSFFCRAARSSSSCVAVHAAVGTRETMERARAESARCAQTETIDGKKEHKLGEAATAIDIPCWQRPVFLQ